MNSPRPARRRLTLAFAFASAFVIGTAALGSLTFAAPATAASSTEVSSSPTHIWVDPTHPDVNGHFSWHVTIHIPPLSGRAVIHNQTPTYVDGLIECQAPDAVDGGVLSCVGAGNPIPGEYTVVLDLKQEGGPGYTWAVPLTVCPLNGCSDLFSLTVSPTPIVVWANPNIYDQTYGQYDFNIDWNATEVRMEANLLDAQGNPAPGIHDPVSEIPGNGSQFGYRGTFTQPGYYYSTITMVDEFGGEHEAPFTVRVCTPELCRDLLELPSTGLKFESVATAGAIAVLALGAGSVVLVVRRRRS